MNQGTVIRVRFDNDKPACVARIDFSSDINQEKINLCRKALKDVGFKRSIQMYFTSGRSITCYWTVNYFAPHSSLKERFEKEVANEICRILLAYDVVPDEVLTEALNH